MSEIEKLQGEIDDTLKEMAALNRMTCLNGPLKRFEPFANTGAGACAS